MARFTRGASQAEQRQEPEGKSHIIHGSRQQGSDRARHLKRHRTEGALVPTDQASYLEVLHRFFGSNELSSLILCHIIVMVATSCRDPALFLPPSPMGIMLR